MAEFEPVFPGWEEEEAHTTPSARFSLKGNWAESVHAASSRGDWGTPPALFQRLHREFAFTTDLAATRDNALLPAYLGPDHPDPERRDALTAPWDGLPEGRGGGVRGWLNPPYGRGVGKWVDKALRERDKGVLTVMLLAARTDTRWFQQLLLQGCECRFIQGRLRFVGARAGAPFPSAIVVVRPLFPFRGEEPSDVWWTVAHASRAFGG